jgi:hypothetical protein
MFGLSQIEYGYLRPLPMIIPETKIYLFKIHDLGEKEYEEMLRKTSVYTIHSSRDAKDAHESYVKFSSQWKEPVPYPVEKIKALDEKWIEKCHFRIDFVDMFGENAVEILSRMTKIMVENILQHSEVSIKNSNIDIELLLEKTQEATKQNPNMFHPLTLMYNNHKK